jgi:hypothetical protein
MTLSVGVVLPVHRRLLIAALAMAVRFRRPFLHVYSTAVAMVIHLQVDLSLTVQYRRPFLCVYSAAFVLAILSHVGLSLTALTMAIPLPVHVSSKALGCLVLPAAIQPLVPALLSSGVLSGPDQYRY